MFRCLVFWVNTLFCVYISALSGGTSVCRVIILLELSEVLLIELVARSVRIQLALRAWCSLVGRRCRPQLGIAFRQMLHLVSHEVCHALNNSAMFKSCSCHLLVKKSSCHVLFLTHPFRASSDRCCRTLPLMLSTQHVSMHDLNVAVHTGPYL